MIKEYISASSLDEVLDALAKSGKNAKLIAGGSDLILEINSNLHPKVDTLIDVSRVEGSKYIRLGEDGYIHIGPNVTHNDCLSSPLIREKAGLLAEACWHVATPQIRNRGTIAGNLVTASPANDTITVLIALEARVSLTRKTETRVVPLADFYSGLRKTVMRPDEYLTDISFLPLNANYLYHFEKAALRRAQAIAVANVAVILELDGNRIVKSVVTLGAVAPTIIHAEEAESFLLDKELNEENIREAARLAANDAQPIDDIRSSAAYRKKMIEVMVRRSMLRLLNEDPRCHIPNDPIVLREPNYKYVSLQKSEHWAVNKPIQFTLNGKPISFIPDRHKMLIHLLREEGLLTGTKEGCMEGECGSCSVIMDGEVVLSCLVPAQRAAGTEIITVEGLQQGERLHPVQQGFVDTGAVQCGYCTPGFLISSSMLLQEKENPNKDDIRQAVAGNLCRCTGYYSIVEAIEKAIAYGRSQ